MFNHIKRNYHWVIVLLVSLEMAIVGGIINSMNVFVIPICEDMNVSRSSYALMDIPYRIAVTAATAFAVIMYRRVGYRKTALVSMVVAVIALVGMAVSNNLIAVGLCRTLLGVCSGMALTAGAVWIVKDWFIKYIGFLIGLVNMFTGLGGSAVTITFTAIIEKYDWRAACVAGAAMVGITVICYSLFLRDKPEMLGLKQLGYGTLYKTKTKRNRNFEWQGFSMREWRKKPLLYITVAYTLVSAIAVYTSYTVLVPHFQDQGFTPQEAAVYQSACMLALAVSKLLCGVLSDKIGAKIVGACCVACCAVGQALLGTTANPVLCYVSVFLIAIGLGTTTIMIPLLTSALFGYYASDSINSILLALIPAATVLANLISNLGFDYLGSYSPVFRASAVVGLIIIAVYTLMLVLAKKERRLFENKLKEASINEH